MEYIVKKQAEAEGTLKGYNIPISPEKYDFYTSETVTDVLGKEVQIPKLAGSYSLEELQRQQLSIEASLEDVKVKISMIESYGKG